MDRLSRGSDTSANALLSAWARSAVQGRWSAWLPRRARATHHRRDHHTLLVVFDAHLRLGTTSGAIEVPPQSLAILPPVAMYAAEVRSAQDDTQVFLAGFSAEAGPEGEPWSRLPLPLAVPASEPHRYRPLCDQVHRRLFGNGEETDLLQRTRHRLQARPALDALLTGYLEDALGAGVFGPLAQAGLPSSLREAVQILRTRMNDPNLKIATVAAELGVSVRTLLRLFRSGFGCSPQTYLARLRLDHAGRLLAGGDADGVAGVAARCGYRNPSAFGQAFARLHGHPPGRWRRTRPTY